MGVGLVGWKEGTILITHIDTTLAREKYPRAQHGGGLPSFLPSLRSVVMRRTVCSVLNVLRPVGPSVLWAGGVSAEGPCVGVACFGGYYSTVQYSLCIASYRPMLTTA